MLAGLLEPTSGEIRINELPIRKYWREIQWQIGFMPDFFGVYEDLLVWEYLDFFARCYKLVPDRRDGVSTSSWSWSTRAKSAMHTFTRFHAACVSGCVWHMHWFMIHRSCY